MWDRHTARAGEGRPPPPTPPHAAQVILREANVLLPPGPAQLLSRPRSPRWL